MKARYGIILPVLCAAASAIAADPAPTVTASSIHSDEYRPEYATDGNGETRWASRGAGEAGQWLQVDFGRPVAVTGMVLHWEAAYAAAYEIRLSDDAQAWTAVHRQEAGKGGREEIAGLQGRGRYLRVQCLKTGPHGLFSIWELEFPGGEAATVLAEFRARAAEARRAEAERNRLAFVEALEKTGAEEVVFAVRRMAPDGHWYANFSYYSDWDLEKTSSGKVFDGERRVAYLPGARLCRLNLRTGARQVLLDDPGGGIRDPAVSYDGRTIVFAYRKAGDGHYRLYTIRPDGTDLRPLIGDAADADDIEPCWLPDGGILFVSSRCKRWVNCWVTQVAVLYRVEADGTGLRVVSSNLEHDNTPWPLPDGRVLYTRWEYIDRSQVDYHHLWVTNPDGTGQMIYYGNQQAGTVMIDARPIPGSHRIAALFSPGHGKKEHAGPLAVVDPARGPDDRGSVRIVCSDGELRDPWPFDEETFLAARFAEIVGVRAGEAPFALYALGDEDRKAGYWIHEPRPLAPRPREPVIPSRIDPGAATGRLILADIYEGRNMESVQRGEIRKLLVLESLPKPINFTGGMDPLSYGGTFTLERVVGTVPVEADGSAYLELPALRSFFFVALDEHDLAVKRMQSFLTVQPGETTACVGCHEQRTRTLLKRDNLLALQRPPRPVEPVAGMPEVFDFPRDIQPVLDALCVDCHGYEATARGGPASKGIILAGDRGPMYSHSYFELTVNQLFSDGRNKAVSNYAPRTLGSSASRILTMLDGSHNGVKATDRQKALLRLWIESGAAYPGTYAALGCGSIGGYAENHQVHTDYDWPETRAAAAVLDRRCGSCHQKDTALPRALSDERGMSFWRFPLPHPAHGFSRHIVFNLTRPEKSLLLRAPLARGAGGWARCKNPDGTPAAVFADTADPDYAALRAMVEAGRDALNAMTRFDMADFRPREAYVRELKRYGVLPRDFELSKGPVNVYEWDRLYWESLWYRPVGP